MPNNPYNNFVLENEIEDQFNSYLDLYRFCQIDRSLELNDGMKVTIHRYSATDGTEKVSQGQGNSKTITAGYTPVDYEILCAQNRFSWFDEEEMKDPLIVRTGTNHMGVDMFNTTNADVYAEFKKATLVVPVQAFNFDAIVDAQSMFNSENLEGLEFFAFVSPADVAGLRKTLKDDLKYVEKFVTQGYIGTVGGVNIYTKKDAVTGMIIVATKDAVTKYTKTGVSSEAERDANTRKNTMYFRKYYVVALTDEKYAVKVVKGSASASTDTEVDSDKVYFEKIGLGYHQVKPAEGDNPQSKGWYEITENF